MWPDQHFRTMANISSNASEVDLLGRRVVTGVFLTLVITVVTVDIVVIAALFANTQLNRTVRFIVVNLLLGSIIVAFAAIIFHSFYGAAVAWRVLVDLQVYTRLCQSAVFLFFFGGAGRFIFTTLYATTVFVLVRFWNKPTIEPRNTKYFIVTGVIIWIVAFFGAAPVISRELVTSLCVTSIQQIDIGFYAYLSSHIFFFSLLPAILSFTLLTISSCYLKQALANSPGAKKTSKPMLKFGFFLLLGQGFNIVGSIIAPFLTLITAELTEGIPAVLVNVCIFDLSLIPLPILAALFFTSVWEKLRMYIFCCCCHPKPVSSKTVP